MCIFIRKLLLTAITVFAGEQSVRHALLALLVVLCATAMHLRCQPFAHYDANLAESLTLAATILVPIVGLGQQAATGASAHVTVQGRGSSMDLGRATQAAIDGFNQFCYSVMGACILVTMYVIIRRVSGVVFLFRKSTKQKLRENADVHLPDRVMDLLDKSQTDIASLWATVGATSREREGLEETFDSILRFQSDLDFQLTKKTARFADQEHITNH